MKTALFTLPVLMFWMAGLGAHAAPIVGSPSLTITNPAPSTDDLFGNSLAAVGTNTVLIGAHLSDIGATNSGVAYLFRIDGTLLTTITNPTPANNDTFSASVAAVGLDNVLIGAPSDDRSAIDAGVAYLFATNGTLITTFTNPAPRQGSVFGRSLAALGADRVIISAPNHLFSGIAYLFSTNGTLLRTLSNSAPRISDFFGVSVAAFGVDKVLIGAAGAENGAGVTHVFSTNGTLLNTFTNPTPAASDSFGAAISMVGTDKLVIGAVRDDAGATDAGAAYLFATNRALVTTFVNPAPAQLGAFGRTVAAVGPDKVMIGAPDQSNGGLGFGLVYLFDTNGTLLATFIDSNSSGGQFGNAITAVDADRVLIATGADTVFLFNVGPVDAPLLKMDRIGSNVRVSWLRPSTGFVLEQTMAIAVPPTTSVWNPVATPYQTNATHISVDVAPTGNRFYRLNKP